MLDIGFGAAFLAGVLSFFTPCVLPIVPPYLAYLAGVSVTDFDSRTSAQPRSRKVFITALVFVAGFTTVFVALGATASVIGQSLAQYFDILSIIAGIMITIMGLHFMGVFKISLLYRDARINVANKPAGFVGAYVMGLAFAFGWTPCVGPALAAILFIAGAESTAMRGAVLLAVYSLGIGLPFALAGLFAGRFVSWSRRFKHHMHMVERIMGFLLILTGVLFMTGQMSAIAQWLLETFPALSTLG